MADLSPTPPVLHSTNYNITSRERNTALSTHSFQFFYSKLGHLIMDARLHHRNLTRKTLKRLKDYTVIQGLNCPIPRANWPAVLQALLNHASSQYSKFPITIFSSPRSGPFLTSHSS